MCGKKLVFYTFFLASIFSDPGHAAETSFNNEKSSELKMILDSSNSLDHDEMFERISVLIREGANPDTQGKNKNTILHLAAAEGLVEYVEFLLAKGANPDLTNRDGFSPCMLASQNGYAHAVEALAVAGANLNLSTQYWERAIQLASQNGNINVIQILALYEVNMSSDKNLNDYLHVAQDLDTIDALVILGYENPSKTSIEYPLSARIRHILAEDARPRIRNPLRFLKLANKFFLTPLNADKENVVIIEKNKLNEKLLDAVREELGFGIYLQITALSPFIPIEVLLFISSMVMHLWQTNPELLQSQSKN